MEESNILEFPLPEYCSSGRDMESVDGVVIHFFSARNVVANESDMFDLGECYKLFTDLNRDQESRQHFMLEKPWPTGRMFASAHIMIGRKGEIWKLLDYNKQAYHAGKSLLEGRSNCNRWTLGIELIGHQHSGFTKEQYAALAELLSDLENEFGFTRNCVAGHDAVRHAAIENGVKAKYKYDPSGRRDGEGDNFDWYYLGKLWNDIRPNPAGVNNIDDLSDVIDNDPLSVN